MNGEIYDRKETNMADEKEQGTPEEPLTEVTELSEENLDDVAGGRAALDDDVNNSSCNGNCGC